MDEALADGVTDEARRLVDLQLRHDPRPVGLSGLGADAEELRDLLGRPAFGHELQNLALAIRQRVAGKLRLVQRRLDDDAAWDFRTYPLKPASSAAMT